MPLAVFDRSVHHQTIDFFPSIFSPRSHVQRVVICLYRLMDKKQKAFMSNHTFEAYQLGTLQLKNRIVMAPMTRSRAINNTPNELMATYYGNAFHLSDI